MSISNDATNDTLVVYTYATTATNPGPGGYAAVWSDGQSKGHWSAHIEESSAVRLAMHAIIDALERIPSARHVQIRTGMQELAHCYSNGSVSEWRENNWLPTSACWGIAVNADLWVVLDDLININPATIEIVHGLPKGSEVKRCRELAIAARDIADKKASTV